MGGFQEFPFILGVFLGFYNSNGFIVVGLNLESSPLDPLWVLA